MDGTLLTWEQWQKSRQKLLMVWAAANLLTVAFAYRATAAVE